MSVYEKLFDLLIAICIMLLFPMLYFSKKSQLITYQAIQRKAEQFVEVVLTQGKLTKVAYESFHESVNAYSTAIQITLSYEEHVYEPKYELSSATGNFEFTGEVMEYDDITPGEEILNVIFQEQKDYNMEAGGYFQITIRFMNHEQAIYSGGTVRAYISLCNNFRNFIHCVYYNQGYFLCTV